MELRATIAEIRQETPTVKSYVLDLNGQDLDFLPGQYVDVLFGEPPRYYAGGGYSITSTPLDNGVLHLAVKRLEEGSDSVKLHERGKVGDPALVMGPGGDFYYELGSASSLVLVAGGIGITPLMSIVRYVTRAEPHVRVQLLYSARTPDELAFRSELEAIAASNPRFRCLFTVTGAGDNRWSGRVGRLDRDALREAGVDPHALYFLCGPPPMVAEMTEYLAELDVAASRVHSEQW